ncbi:hypothetical protein K435DRAFT_968983 [Dendrothele bispora CBS 962.96]|uniref:Uncharacterized protein n=1 Tax=Dendrothele bispora (strain CBS 962.96) TaxID=1314807 RepID=A0A4S8LL75_DENBC|nr:hypothetical protein K435DRAFT_968983 [Dendrothele bispora CBS 962.96]
MSGDDVAPISGSDVLFARAYAHAIKTKFQLDVGDHYCILTSPVTQRGVAAGDLIYPEMTNYLLYKFADNLQYSDNPTYTGGSAGSYLQQLRSYLDWVSHDRFPDTVPGFDIDWMTTGKDWVKERFPDNGNPPQLVVERMTKARDANSHYFTVQKQAMQHWKQVKALYPTLDFRTWVQAGNYPPLDAAQRARDSKQSKLFTHYSPDASALEGYVRNITKAMETTIHFTGFNQSGLVDDQDLISKATQYANSGVKPPETDISQSLAFVPAYTIANYNSTVQAWITAAGRGATRDQVITIDINKGKNTTWQHYGFREVWGGGEVGFWPFLSAEVYVDDNKREERTLKIEGREDSISLQLAMIGVQKFDVSPGQWDVPNIKTLFPNRLPNAPDVLSPKLARIVSVLVGYDVELKVSFGPEMREEVHSIYDEVKSTGGRMSIFGFHVDAGAGAGAGSTEHVNTKFNNVKWDKARGSMSLTPTAGQVYPTILGAVAQRFD